MKQLLFMFACVLGLLSLSVFLSPAEVKADGCRTVSVGRYYSAPVIQQQQYTYNQGVTYNHQQYGYITVPKAFFAHVAEYKPVYLGISDDYRQREFAKEVAEQLARINAQNQPGNGPPNLTKPAAANSKIGTILTTRCATCHAPNKTEPDLSGNPDDIPEIVRLKCFAEVAKNKMPKKGPPLPQDEFDELGAWSELRPVGKTPNLTIPPKKNMPEAKK